MEQNNEKTGNKVWEERFIQLQCQNKQQNDRLKIFSETVESKFSMLMKTLEHLEKLKYDEQENAVSTPSKNARASAESPKCRIRMSVENPPLTEQVESNHQLSDNENSSVTGLFDMSDKEDSLEE